MARYKLRVPSPGTALYGDSDTAIVADTLAEAREFWEDYDGEPAIYLSSSIGRCRVAYKRDVEAGDCHEDADPGDTTVDYLRDDGRELGDSEVRVWVRGYDGPTPLVNRDPVVGDITEMPIGVKVRHEVWGWGQTVALPLHHRQGWRLPVDFCGLYPAAPWPGAAGGCGGSPKWVGHWALTMTQTDTPTGRWPATRWHVDIGDERVVEGVRNEQVARALGEARYARLQAEWEAEQFAAWEREQTAVSG